MQLPCPTKWGAPSVQDDCHTPHRYTTIGVGAILRVGGAGLQPTNSTFMRYNAAHNGSVRPWAVGRRGETGRLALADSWEGARHVGVRVVGTRASPSSRPRQVPRTNAMLYQVMLRGGSKAVPVSFITHRTQPALRHVHTRPHNQCGLACHVPPRPDSRLVTKPWHILFRCASLCTRDTGGSPRGFGARASWQGVLGPSRRTWLPNSVSSSPARKLVRLVNRELSLLLADSIFAPQTGRPGPSPARNSPVLRVRHTPRYSLLQLCN